MGAKEVDGAAPRHRPAGRRDRAALESRRREAAGLFRQGLSQADVAHALKVSRQSVSRWYQQWQRGGMRSLRKSERAGRPPRLTQAQLRRVEKALLKGAVVNGYPTELWTLRRVAEVIERVTGVAYHQGHVWRILRRLGWSRQKPARRSAERDEKRIEAWIKDDWPAIKRGLSETTRGSSSRTRAASP